MNTLDVFFLCFINLLSFIIGAMIGQRCSKGKEITLNPKKVIKENIREKKEDLRKQQLDTMLSNIDNYDGSGFGQKEIPR